MAALSVTTVALSLSDGCPGLAFYVLEIIINTSMILEVAVRFVAFGRVSFTSSGGQYSTSTQLTLGSAILEITLQHIRSHPHIVLRNHPSGTGICGLWCHEQGGRNARHPVADSP